MGEYNYIVGGLFGFFIFVIILGPLGGADDIYDDEFVVIDSNDYTDSELQNLEYDFDMQELLFNPDLDAPEPYQSASLTRDLIINNSENVEFTETGIIRGGLDGQSSVVFNVTDRTDGVIIPFNFNSFRGNTIQFYISGKTPENDSIDAINQLCLNRIVPSGEQIFLDLGNESVPNDACDGSVDENVKTFIVRFTPTSTQTEKPFIDLSGGTFETDDSGSLLESQIAGGFLEPLFRFFRYVSTIVGEVFSMMGAYLRFTIELPGLMGTVLRGYALILISVFVIKEGWLG